jgi:hypothetical protein
MPESSNSFVPAFLGAALGVCAVLLMYGSTPAFKRSPSSSAFDISQRGVVGQASEDKLAPGSPRHEAELSRRASGRLGEMDSERTPDKVS